MDRKETASGHRNTPALLMGTLAVAGFSVTLPATRVAVTYLDPLMVGLGRSIVAAMIAGVLLAVMRQPLPNLRQIKSLLLAGAGVIIGFPLLSAFAMTQVPASHAVIMVAIIPLFTAAAGALRNGERPSIGFWLTSVTGTALIMVFALLTSTGGLKPADVLLIIAALVVAVGYAEGGRLAQELGGWQVICWALLLMAPFLLIPVGVSLARHGMQAPWQAWAGFFYVSLVSQLFAFVLWYQALARGGVVRVSQVQLLQPFMSLIVSAFLLEEQVTTAMYGFAVLIVIVIAIGKKMPIRASKLIEEPV